MFGISLPLCFLRNPFRLVVDAKNLSASFAILLVPLTGNLPISPRAVVAGFHLFSESANPIQSRLRFN